jgi:8-oxo-dGTP diphosphatase
MLDFKHCPRCAASLHATLIEAEGRERLLCTNCGFIFYINPRIVCGTLPEEDGKVWLLRRGIEPRYGYWSYPAGYQEIDESSDEAAARETTEEIGSVVEIVSLFGVYSRPLAPVVNLVYLARFAVGSPRPHTTPESVEVRSFSAGEIPWSELAFESTHQVLRDWVRLRRGEDYAGGG